MEGISATATESLNRYSWPGNVRELQNVIERAAILSHGSILELENDQISVSLPRIHRDKLQAGEETQPAAQASSLKTLDDVERAHICAVLQQTRGVIEGANGAAKTLGMHPNTLRHRMEKLGIKRAAHRIS
jgi:formate hydrogenlyase transcriptional activator